MSRAVDSPNGLEPIDLARLRGEAMVRGLVHAWRRLTTEDAARRAGEGGRTLVACSGGADSTALVLGLCASLGARARRERLVVGHVVHDLRPVHTTARERDFVRDLCARVGVEFVDRSVRVRGESSADRGNVEERARRARYGALVEMAREVGAGFVATAHHADDQAETVLMRLVRGAGARGLSAMRTRRVLARANGAHARVMLVRPMLAMTDPVCTRAACRGMCERAGVGWMEDASNADTSRLRAALRHRVLPVLEEISPGAAARVARSARALEREHEAAQWAAGRVIEGAVGEDETGASVVRLARARVRELPAGVVSTSLVLACRVVSGRRGADRLGWRVVESATRAARDRSTQPRVMGLGACEMVVTAREIVVRARGAKANETQGDALGAS